MDKKCDGNIDCTDKSDEEDCPVQPKKQGVCDEGSFTCASSTSSSLRCIKSSMVCDKSNDCGDWSDEPDNCNINECEDDSLHHCSDKCVDDLIGYHCECNKGFKLGSDNKTCEDIDECNDVPGTCSGHPCINTKGHFKCQCLPGYEVKEHKYCKLKTASEAFLLTTTRKDIRSLSLAPAVFPFFSHRRQHYIDYYDKLAAAVATDYSLQGNYLIWSDVQQEKLYIALLDKNKPSKFVKGDNPQVLLEGNVGVVDGLAIDYVHNLLYWTDTTSNTIEVAFLQEPTAENTDIVALRKTIIDKDLDEPRGIVVNVKEGFLFWSDWGDHPKIERSSQDGSDRRVIVDNNIVWPNGLAIDHVLKMIYWVDVKLNTLETADFYGNNRRIILKSPRLIAHPFAVDVFEDNIYWSDWALLTVSKINKFTSNASVEHVLGPLYSVNDIKVVHPSSQPKDARHRCSNEGCSHLCLPSGGSFGFQCLCPSPKKGVKFTLASDGKSCLVEAKAPWATSDPSGHRHSSENHISFDVEVTTSSDFGGSLISPLPFALGALSILASACLLMSLLCYRQTKRYDFRRCLSVCAFS